MKQLLEKMYLFIYFYDEEIFVGIILASLVSAMLVIVS